MSSPLLATKFIQPPIGDRHLSRPRLWRKLEEGLQSGFSLALVCGPAGYGKTTLVSEWIQSSEQIHALQFAWLTLERSDDDLTRFLSYFVAALQHIHPGIGEGVLRLLRTHKPAPVPVLATLLINEINEINRRCFLILDDFHLITNQSVQDFIGFLVEHQPQQLGLVLITRADPPLPLARMRARGQLVEVRQSDLAFTPDELAAFVNKTMGLDLSPTQIKALETQTEGWIAGLQLAALSLRSGQDRATFFATFSGKHGFIADYLTEEVLARMLEPERTFLLQTSILERLCAPLCEAVTGKPGAQSSLEKILEANLFIMPLDNHHTWYRYHPLFADLLSKRLQEMQPGSVAGFHRQASRWYRENGLVDLAIEHALAGEDIEQAALLIEEIAESALMHGEVMSLIRWLESLPEVELSIRPRLACLYGVALTLCGRSVKEVVILLDKVRQVGDLTGFSGELALLEAFMAIMQGDLVRTIELAEQALRQIPTERAFFRSLAADTLGLGHTLTGDLAAASRAFEQVVEISQQSENVMMTMIALTNLAGLQLMGGHLRSAFATCKQVVELAEQRIGEMPPVTGKTLLNMGEILREQGNLDAAIDYFSRAVVLMEQFTEIGLPVAYLSLAKTKMMLKDWSAAQADIDQARRLAQASQSTQLDDRLVKIAQARLWIWRGDLSAAMSWARDEGFLERTSSNQNANAQRNAMADELFQAQSLVLIHLYLAQLEPARAFELIEGLIEANRKRGYKRRQVELLVLKALALQQMERLDGALEALGQALILGEPEGYHMTFVEHGDPMAKLLYQAIEHGISPVYAGHLLDSITLSLSTHTSKWKEDTGLIEALSDREMDVLGLVAEGLSNAEIAQRLFISLSTVKGHIANIFGKLNVRNRTQAVARARSLGLLPHE